MKETTLFTIFTVNDRSLKPTTVYYNYNGLIVIIQELRCHWALTRWHLNRNMTNTTHTVC